MRRRLFSQEWCHLTMDCLRRTCLRNILRRDGIIMLRRSFGKLRSAMEGVSFGTSFRCLQIGGIVDRLP